MTSSDQPFDAEHRARVVAGIRALADLIERSTDLPVPDSVDAQYSIIGDLDDDGRQLVHDAAAALGVEPKSTDYLATARYIVAKNDWRVGEQYYQVNYTVHGDLPEPPAAASDELDGGVNRGSL